MTIIVPCLLALVSAAWCSRCAYGVGRSLLAGEGDFRLPTLGLPISLFATAATAETALGQAGLDAGFPGLKIAATLGLTMSIFTGYASVIWQRGPRMLYMIRSMRPTACLFGSLLALAAYRLEIPRGVPGWENIIVACLYFFALAGTMLMNDWHDREADAMKGKTLARDFPGHFLLWSAGCWFAAAAFMALAGERSHGLLTVLLAGLILPCCLYSRTYRIPFLPAAAVALASSTAILCPMASPLASHRAEGFALYAAVALALMCRELMKDEPDIQIDTKRKWTVTAEWGIRANRRTASAFLLVSAAIVAAFRCGFAHVPVAVCLGVLAAWYASESLKTSRAKATLDAVTLLFLVGTALSGA